jgi:hypothetical protein
MKKTLGDIIDFLDDHVGTMGWFLEAGTFMYDVDSKKFIGRCIQCYNIVNTLEDWHDDLSDECICMKCHNNKYSSRTTL